MTLAVVVKGSEGLVLAVDSRVTLTTTLPNKTLIPATFDNATKLLKVKGQEYIAALTYGQGALGQASPRTPHSFIPEFETELVSAGRLSVKEFAKRLAAFYKAQWDAAAMPASADPMGFLVAGFDEDATYGTVYGVMVPNTLQPVEYADFGLRWGGQSDIAIRLLNGYDPIVFLLVQQSLGLSDQDALQLQSQVGPKLGMPIPYQFLPLQDCLDLAILLVRTTASLQSFYVGIRGVGGAIDVATITRTEGFKSIQQKAIEGERSVS